VDKYRSRLSPKNLLNLKQLTFVASGLLRVFDERIKGDAGPVTKVKGRFFKKYICLF